MCPAIRELIQGRRPGRCLLIAELGVNHDGRLDTALQLLHAARAAGADAAKLQLFVPTELCSPLHRAAEIAMLERLRLSDEDHARLVAEAERIHLPLLATPFDEPSLELLQRLRIPLIKIASGEVTHTPFLASVARTAKPVILSTGGCTLQDVDRAVATLRGAGCRALSLLHCVSAYPPPDAQVNLRVVSTLIARYPSCPVGFSDHTLGDEAALAAVALGACIIEKHLTLDCGAAGPDHAASADPPAFAALVRRVRRIEDMLGSPQKSELECEGRIGRSIVAAIDLPSGTVLRPEHLAFKRPGTGMRPYEATKLIGRRLRSDVRANQQLESRMLAPAAALLPA